MSGLQMETGIHFSPKTLALYFVILYTKTLQLKATYINNRWPDVNDEIHAARQRLGIILLADVAVTQWPLKMPASQQWEDVTINSYLKLRFFKKNSRLEFQIRKNPKMDLAFLY